MPRPINPVESDHRFIPQVIRLEDRLSPNNMLGLGVGQVDNTAAEIGLTSELEAESNVGASIRQDHFALSHLSDVTNHDLTADVPAQSQHSHRPTNGQPVPLPSSSESEELTSLGMVLASNAKPATVAKPQPPAEQGAILRSVRAVDPTTPVGANRPILPRDGALDEVSFIDPSVKIKNPKSIHIGLRSYIAPFATLDASKGATIEIGEESDVQDNVLIAPGPGNAIHLGDKTIIAHNATILGNATIGKVAPDALPAFVGFNSIVDGATVEEDAMVTHLCKVDPGITIHSGMKVLPGKHITTQAEADNPGLGKVAAVTAADRAFMDGVIEVNTEFAQGYTNLFFAHGKAAFKGIGPDPDTTFNPGMDFPTLAGVNLTFGLKARNRIIGDVAIGHTAKELNKVLGKYDSIRADEGDDAPSGHANGFNFDTILDMGDRFTMHALEHTGVSVGAEFDVGFHSVVHGGADDGNSNDDTTVIGDLVTVGDYAVVFRSTVGSGINIGNMAYVDGSQLYLNGAEIWADTDDDGIADDFLFGAVNVPAQAIIINNVLVGTVEWSV